jgi:predicted nucleic acid-binding protein
MILIDSSVWIAFFKGNESAKPLIRMIDSNAICINDLILAELLPMIEQKRELHLKELLLTITKIPLHIDWTEIIEMQSLNLQQGINGVGIADLIILQNAKIHNIPLFSFDKHFLLMSQLHHFQVFNP